jgi:hypothetical protein
MMELICPEWRGYSNDKKNTAGTFYFRVVIGCVSTCQFNPGAANRSANPNNKTYKPGDPSVAGIPTRLHSNQSQYPS